MRAFWYVSKTKVDAFLSDDRNWTDRIGARVRFALPPFEVEAEGRARPERGMTVSVERLERRAESEFAVPSAAEIGDDTPVLFRFEGRSARVVDDGTFWVAVVDGVAAVLLVGSSANAIGSGMARSGLISPSADPLGAVSALVRGSVDATTAMSLSSAWADVFRQGTLLVSAAALPRTAGLAVYAGWQPAVDSEIALGGWSEPIERVVVGSPIFVEQIAAA